MNAATIAAGLVLAALLPGMAAAQSVQATPDHSVALPPAKNGVITPETRRVDPRMPVLHPGGAARTPVIRPPASNNGRVVQPR